MAVSRWCWTPGLDGSRFATLIWFQVLSKGTGILAINNCVQEWSDCPLNAVPYYGGPPNSLRVVDLPKYGQAQDNTRSALICMAILLHNQSVSQPVRALNCCHVLQ